MANLRVTLKAEAAAQALAAITGEEPHIIYGPDYARVYWSTDQQARLQAKFARGLDVAASKAMTPTAPGEVRVDYAPIVNPVIARRTAPLAIVVAVGLVGLGFLLGRKL